ncbi:MAG: hypothetical protein CVV23_01790 [Ignavibacteriae bacterium HGW-Ignavibacteriae-2]|jgi:chromosome segregation ATPase|nr:MAG: hypothetical protein CVV23_01790 [Ignavibacteriae bacterium HGW-Ignavibacteriae-2]
MGLFNTSSRAEVDRLIVENESLRNSLNKALQNFDSIEDLENKLAEKRTVISELSKEEKQILDSIQKSNEEKVIKSKSIADLDTRINSLENERISLLNTIERYNKELLELDELKVQRRENVENLMEAVFEKEQKTRKLDSDIEARNIAVEELDNKIAELKLNFEELHTLNEAIGEKLNRQKAEIKDLEKKSESIKDDNEKSFKNVDYIKKEISILEKEKFDIQQSIELLQKEESDKRNSIYKLDQIISSNEEVKNNLDLSLTSLTKQLSEKDKLYNEYSIKKDNITEIIITSKTELENLRHDIQAIKIVIDDYNEDMLQLERKRTKTTSEVHKLEAAKRQFEDAIFRMREEEEALKAQLGLLKNRINALESKKFEIEETNLRLESKFTEAIDKFSGELKEAKLELNSYKHLLLLKNKEYKEVETALLEKSTLISEYTGMVQVLKKEKENLEETIEKYNSRKEGLQNKIIEIKDEHNKFRLNIKEMLTENDTLLNKKMQIEKDLLELLNFSSENYKALHDKNKLLTESLVNNETLLDEISKEIELKNESLIKLGEDISKSEIDREEFLSKISQLIALEKTFQFKIDNYKKEIKKIDAEPGIETEEELNNSSSTSNK